MSSFLELSEQDRQALLFQSACNYLSRREHSRLELKDKLKKKYKEAKEDEIEEILKYLLEKNLQSDERFLISFVESATLKGHGPNKIRYKLRSKGINSEKLEDELAKYDFDSIAQKLFSNKYSNKIQDITDLNYSEKEKFKYGVNQFLYSRGFEQKTIMKIIVKI